MPDSKGKRPGFLVLAAGQSRRFGDDCKLSTCLPNGKTLFGSVIENLTAITANICVVYSAENAALAQIVQQHNIKGLEYPKNSPGLGDSIALGVRATRSWSGWIICLADMPYITRSVYHTIYCEAEKHSLLAPQYQGERGHPVFFSADYYAQLASLTGDRGAASILKQNVQSLTLLPTKCAGVIQDIDTPSDLLP